MNVKSRKYRTKPQTSPCCTGHAVRGAAMVWVLCILALIAILVTGVLYISTAYFNRSLVYGKRRQAYLTSKAAVDIITGKLTGRSENDYGGYSLNTPFRMNIGNNEDESGVCNAVITKNAEMITVTATTVFQEQTSTVRATMNIEEDRVLSTYGSNNKEYYSHDGFEDGLNGWGSFGNSTVQVSSERQYSGTYSAKISNRQYGPSGIGISLNKATFTQGARFKISARVCFPEITNNVNVKISMKYKKADGTEVFNSFTTRGISSGEKGNWVQVTCDFSMRSEEYKEATLYFETDGEENNVWKDFFIDEIIVAPEGKDVNLDTKNLFRYTFEDSGSGDSGLSDCQPFNYSTLQISSEQKKSGGSSVKITNRKSCSSGIAFPLDRSVFLPNTNVQIRAYFCFPQVDIDNLSVKVTVKEGDDPNNPTGFTDVTSRGVSRSDAGNWLEISTNYYINQSNTQACLLYFETLNESGSFVDFFMDEVVITPASGSARYYSFESQQAAGRQGWVDNDNNAGDNNTSEDVRWFATGEQKKEGNQSLLVENRRIDWQGVQKMFSTGELQPNQRYCISAWFKARNGNKTDTERVKLSYKYGTNSGGMQYCWAESKASASDTKMDANGWNRVRIFDCLMDTNDFNWSSYLLYAETRDGTILDFFMDEVIICPPYTYNPNTLATNEKWIFTEYMAG